MIKTIIFDLGNVIVKVNWKELYKKFAQDSGKTIDYFKNYYENSSIMDDFAKGRFSPREFYNKIVKELNLKINFKTFSKHYCDIFTLNDDVAELIQRLKKNFRLILLSNTDIMHFEYIKNKYEIINIFDEYVLSYKVGYRKPNPIIFIETLKKAKPMPFNCAYFDDIPEFIFVARLLGIRAFRYRNFEKLVKDLRKINVLTKPL
ncbi:HAD family phosphatase [Candidatus Woesearchaeota archaeon]|nr:HAD family phosphatase [Candidatus Woesearchaeota archaeon]